MVYIRTSLNLNLVTLLRKIMQVDHKITKHMTGFCKQWFVAGF